jgi:glucosamine-phosphate N-acetyltransferase
MPASLHTELETLVRPLRGPDLDHGFLDVIRSFRPFALSREEAGNILRERLRRGIHTLVAECEERVMGTASLLVDHKFINHGGKVAIVEDVIVLPAYQGLGVGRKLMQSLEELANTLGCYKICLYCSDELLAYYARLGFDHTDAFMRKDLR